MSKSFEVVERVGISTECPCDAIKNVVKESHAEKPIAWFEVIEERGRVNSEGVIEFQCVVKIGRQSN